MRVLFDHQIFWLQRYGGISRYFVELIERLRGLEVDARISTWCSENQHLLASRLIADGIAPSRPVACRAVQFAEKAVRRDLVGFVGRKASEKALKRGGFDVFHPTYYYPYFLEHLDGRPFVLTVHDMIHEVLAHEFSSSDFTARNKKAVGERADRIIAISESTKQDIVRLYGVAPSRIDIVPHGSSLDPALAASRPETLPSRYVLFVGNRYTYKNFDLFARAMSEVMREEQDLHLVCGGGGAFGDPELRQLNCLGIGDRTMYTDIDDLLLTRLYRDAEAFVFPSLYEGFGIPILEAMSCGCPVVASNTSSFPEVLGDAGAMFEPRDERNMAGTILDVLRDGEARQRMRERGLARAKQFSWDITAMKTLDVYEKLM